MAKVRFVIKGTLIGVVIIFAVMFTRTIFLRAKLDHLYQTERTNFENANNLWELKRPDKYRLVIESTSDVGKPCTQESFVDQSTTVVSENTCEDPYIQSFKLWNVDELFRLASADLDMMQHQKCGPNGCRCSGPLIIYVSYDEYYGFPVALSLKPEKKFSDAYFISWNIFRPCYLLGMFAPGFKVKEFEIIP